VPYQWIYAFRAMMSTPSCLPSATPPGMILPALIAIREGDACGELISMDFGRCIVYEFQCFWDQNCRRCLAALSDSNRTETKTAVLNSPACVAAEPSNRQSALFQVLGSDAYGNCANIYPCTFWKQQCAASAECSKCWTTLRNGNGALAANQCPRTEQGYPPGWILEQVVEFCTGPTDHAACSYAHERCADFQPCKDCLAILDSHSSSGGTDSARAVAEALSTASCQAAMEARGAAWEERMVKA
jgi:hypothetical protein